MRRHLRQSYARSARSAREFFFQDHQEFSRRRAHGAATHTHACHSHPSLPHNTLTLSRTRDTLLGAQFAASFFSTHTQSTSHIHARRRPRSTRLGDQNNLTSLYKRDARYHGTDAPHARSCECVTSTSKHTRTASLLANDISSRPTTMASRRQPLIFLVLSSFSTFSSLSCSASPILASTDTDHGGVTDAMLLPSTDLNLSFGSSLEHRLFAH